MLTIPKNHRYLDKRPITIILRLVINRQGVIVHGEIINVEGIPISRFHGPREMTRALDSWVAAQKPK